MLAFFRKSLCSPLHKTFIKILWKWSCVGSLSRVTISGVFAKISTFPSEQMVRRNLYRSTLGCILRKSAWMWVINFDFVAMWLHNGVFILVRLSWFGFVVVVSWFPNAWVNMYWSCEVWQNSVDGRNFWKFAGKAIVVPVFRQIVKSNQISHSFIIQRFFQSWDFYVL